MFRRMLLRRSSSRTRASRHSLFRDRALCALTVALVGVAVVPNVTLADSLIPRGKGSGRVQDAWLVRFRAGVGDADKSAALGSAGAREIGRLDELGTRVVSLPLNFGTALRDRLARDPRVESVERDATAQATVVPRDPHWQQGWGQRLIRAPAAWNATTGKASTIIAVVDTGVDARQPDLRGRVLRGWDFVNDDARPNDDNGHGTAVSGVAAAKGNDGVGIAGLCWQCLILPVKVLNANGSGTHSNIAAGIVWAADHGADVINLSLAGPTASTIVADAVAYARRRGVVVVAAAGNEGLTRQFYPAAYPGVISVGATTGADVLYPWSNRGTWVKVSAPGCAFTGKPGAQWTWWCGTSFASPAVAGIAALIKSMWPNISRADIERTLLQSTIHVRGVRIGRIDAVRAMRAAATLVAARVSP